MFQREIFLIESSRSRKLKHFKVHFGHVGPRSISLRFSSSPTSWRWSCGAPRVGAKRGSSEVMRRESAGGSGKVIYHLMCYCSILLSKRSKTWKFM